MLQGSVAGHRCGSDRERLGRDKLGRAPWAVLGAIALLGTLAAVVLLAGHASADRVPHAPIYISGDGGFTPANGVVSGSGSAADPFVIEEYTISIPFNSGVYIEDTSDYYVLRNVTVLGQRRAGSTGIYLTNSTHGLIECVVVNATETGIRVDSSSALVIDNCTVSYGTAGAILVDCDSVVVRDVAATAFAYGIRLQGCDSCDVDRCTTSGNGQDGIVLERSTAGQTEFCRVMGCNASSNRFGILLGTTRRCEITGCTSSWSRGGCRT